MRRTAKLLMSVVAATATISGVATAASSPTVATNAATNVGNTSATPHATINPNGSDTSYVFQYGITNAYGISTAGHSVGHGTKAVKVGITVRGLTPGTVYHYRVAALNKAGAALGTDHTFKTTGHPPASVVTGPAVNVTKSLATVTGSVNPQGASTAWVVQYGLTTNYTAQTLPPQTLAGVTSALPVSAQLSGLAPATLFHYRIVAFHGATVVSAGADDTFFTEPARRPVPKISAHTKPKRDPKSPYVFTTGGTLRGAGFIPAALRCTGSTGIRYYQGRRQLAFIVVPVDPNCQFSGQATFRRLTGHGPTPVRVTIDFRGNGYLAPADSTEHVSAG
jgi:hypothetical protein